MLTAFRCFEYLPAALDITPQPNPNIDGFGYESQLYSRKGFCSRMGERHTNENHCDMTSLQRWKDFCLEPQQGSSRVEREFFVGMTQSKHCL